MGFIYEKDADNIVTVTMDLDGQSANTMNDQYKTLIVETVDRLEAEPDLAGVVIASAKKTFFAGGDLNKLLATKETSPEHFAAVEQNKGVLRRLERLKAPVVAAINGAALGGGFEICLSCNRRIIVNSPAAVTGLPEVTLGLLPGAGGVVRTVALLGLEKALPILLEGKPQRPEAALKLGMVDEIVERVDDLVPAAKAWIKANPEAQAQPWDQKGFRYPGGDATAPNVLRVATMAPTALVNKTRGLMPAPEKILDIAVNSMRMGFDSALRAETRAFCSLVPTPEAKASITTFFFGMQGIRSGKFRPQGEKWQAKSSAVLGAGMMGAGIAWSHAYKGLPTVLKDTTQTNAETGKSYSEGLVAKRIERGRMTPEKGQIILDQITPTTDDSDYAGADIIIEAVFEDITLKEKVIPETFKQLSKDGIYGSNTSTLPISLLAEFCPDPSRFIGIHFFSPVDKMQLVELIVGEKTSQETVRKAYDYVIQIGKMPIVVNDSRGFFTSRVFGTYCNEGAALLLDGVKPVAIERAGWAVGMPVGPLAVSDEVSLELQDKVYKTHQTLDKRLGVTDGFPADRAATRSIIPTMLQLGRGGRKFGAGYYDYAKDGSKSLWAGLDQFAKPDAPATVPTQDIRDRLIYRQAVETLRCYSEGVLNTEVDGNIGSIFAFGFPAHTGGALQFIRGIGLDAFQVRANELAQAYGDRFLVTDDEINKLRGSSAIAAE